MASKTNIFLQRLSDGDQSATAILWDTVYSELYQVAKVAMQSERREHTLQPTAIVNEVFLRLVGDKHVWQDRAHFLAFASHVIRRILVDHARKRDVAKRGGGWSRVELEDRAIDEQVFGDVDILALEEALKKLIVLHERQAKIVEMRFFAGMSGVEIAEVLKVDRSTVTQDWAMAKAWLSAELSAE